MTKAASWQGGCFLFLKNVIRTQIRKIDFRNNGNSPHRLVKAVRTLYNNNITQLVGQSKVLSLIPGSSIVHFFLIFNKTLKCTIDIIFLIHATIKKCEELKMADWIIPCNPQYYDVVGAFSNLSRIDWKQSAKNIDVNDIVYIYVGRPLMAIKFKCKVNKVNLDFIEIDDSEFIIIGDNYMNYKNHMELELLTQYEDELTLEKLRAHGLNGNVQGPRRLVAELKEFIETFKP